MDWQKIINEVLEDRKINLTELSKKTGISLPHLCHLRNGKRGKKANPSFEIGLAIVKLHPKSKELMDIK